MARKDLHPDLVKLAQTFVDKKYVSRADDRQKAMGIAYVEAERQDLAREIASFAQNYAEAIFESWMEDTLGLG